MKRLERRTSLETTTSVINTSPVDLSAAIAIEAAEACAWTDLYAAAPTDWAATVGLETREVAGALVLSWAATGRRYFSRAIGLGVTSPANAEAIDLILDGYEEAGISMFLLQSLPHCRPAQYEAWLRERGLEPFDAQERVFRGGQPAAGPALGSERDLIVEAVERDTASEWAGFVQSTYGLETGDWLERLVGRPRWHPY